MLKRKVKKSFITVFVLALFIITTSVSADFGSGTVVVPIGGGYVQATNVSRSGNYSYVDVKITSVHPTNGGTDNFKKCKVRLYYNNQWISDAYTLSEENVAPSPVFLYEGTYSSTPVGLCFAGNNPSYPAYVVYQYVGH